MSLSGNIIATLAYFDAFDQPLTAFEVWKHLTVEDVDDAKTDPVSLGDVVSALDDKDIRSRVVFQDGFFFLPGREHLIPLRIGAEKIAVGKLRRIRRLARMLRLMPFIRMIGVTGSLAMKKGKHDSDWDFFVVLKTGRIWTGRTLLTGLLQALGKRRHGNRSKDRACLNYFVTEDRLAIPTEDLFSANEYTFLIPLFGRETFQRFELKNRWIARIKPNFLPTEALPLWYACDSEGAKSVRTALERAFDLDALESWLGKWQKQKIMRNPKTRSEGGHIEASDQALVFLPDPHGPRVYEKFRKRLGEIRLRG